MELDPLTIERARRGDRGAREAFLRRYAGPLHGFLRRAGALTDRAGELEDQVQELLGKLLLALPKFDPGGPATLSTWVFTLAHRWLIDERRRRHLTLAPLDEHVEATVADPAPGADVTLERLQQSRALELAVAGLPEAQRRVFVLAHVHQQSLEAIAEVEGVPVGTIKSRLHRARAALVIALQRRADEEHRGGIDAAHRRG